MSHIYIKGPCAPLTSPSAKFFDTLQALSYTYITVKFQLRSSINVRLKESSLCNRFCTERSHKMGFWVDFGGRTVGANTVGGKEHPSSEMRVFSHLLCRSDAPCSSIL